jgi:hypothetical protein
MSKNLEKAQQYAVEGQYKKAIESLWLMENGAQADLDEARGLLELASLLCTKTDRRLKGECDELIETANRFIAQQTATPMAVLTADSLAVVYGCKVLGGHGLPVQPATSLTLVFRSDELVFVCGEPVAEVPYAEIAALEIGGPGTQRHGGGFIGGGFGAAGAAEGMLIGAALNLLTTRTTISTVVCLKTASAELFLHTSNQTPDALRMQLSPVFTILRQLETGGSGATQTSGGGNAVDRLAKLAELLEKDLITREEFDRLKGDLLRID